MPIENASLAPAVGTPRLREFLVEDHLLDVAESTAAVLGRPVGSEQVVGPQRLAPGQLEIGALGLRQCADALPSGREVGVEKAVDARPVLLRLGWIRRLHGPKLVVTIRPVAGVRSDARMTR